MGGKCCVMSFCYCVGEFTGKANIQMQFVAEAGTQRFQCRQLAHYINFFIFFNRTVLQI